MNPTDFNIGEAFGRVEGKLDMLLARSTAHDVRLATVERKQWLHTGGLAVAVALIMPKLRSVFGL